MLVSEFLSWWNKWAFIVLLHHFYIFLRKNVCYNKPVFWFLTMRVYMGIGVQHTISLVFETTVVLLSLFCCGSTLSVLPRRFGFLSVPNYMVIKVQRENKMWFLRLYLRIYVQSCEWVWCLCCTRKYPITHHPSKLNPFKLILLFIYKYFSCVYPFHSKWMKLKKRRFESNKDDTMVRQWWWQEVN